MMPTKSFKEFVRRRAARGPEFAAALLREGIDTSYCSPLMASIHEPEGPGATNPSSRVLSGK